MPLEQRSATLNDLDEELIVALRQQLAEARGQAPDSLLDEEIEAYLTQLLAESSGDDMPRLQRQFERQAEHAPENWALAAGDERLTYQMLNQRSNQVAHHLRRLGVRADTLVGVCAERSVEMVVGILGALKAGAAYVPLDPNYPDERLAYMLQDTAISVLLTQEQLLPRLPGRPDQTICLDADWPMIARHSNQDPEIVGAPANLAYVIYTSGSTDKPKGVMIAYQSLEQYVQALGERLGITAGDVYLHTASFSFSSSVRQLLLPLAHGAAVVLATADQIRNPIELMALVKRQHVTVMDLTPSYWRSCIHALKPLAADARARLLDNQLRLLLSASEPLLSDLPESWALEFGHPAALVNMFGQTETTGIVATCPITPHPGRLRVVPVGRPISGAQIYILDSSLKLVPPGIPGGVYVGGAGLARGYLHQAGLTAERFIPDPFGGQPGARLYRTGDLARYGADGVLEFLGRADTQVKIRGVRIELGEVEGALRQHSEIGDAVVVAWEVAPGDTRLVAYWVPGHSAAPTVNDLRRFLKDKLPEYMVPAVFVRLESLPLTHSGKVDRRALPPVDFTRLDLAGTFVAPRTAEEKSLAEIWAAVLRLQQVGIHDNFFELGGDSILAMQVVARANQAGLSITPKHMFQYATVAELSAAAATGGTLCAEQGLVTGPTPLAPSQHWFLELDMPARHHFNQTFMFEVRQALEPGLVAQAVQHVLSHHDALRMRFGRAGSEWQQFNAGLDENVPFTWVDLSQVPEAEQHSAIETRAAELQTCLDLSQGPLMRVALFYLGPARASRLLLIIHHLASDGVSRRIVLEDLYRACQQLSHGQAVHLPPKTTAFKYWVEQLVRYAGSAELQSEWAYWLAEPRAPVAPLPLDQPHGVYHLDSSDVVSHTLSVETTDAFLRTAPRLHHAQANDLLLSALLQAFAGWTGSPSLWIDLVSHGREPVFDEVDLSRTVGWCSMTYPLLLTLPDSGESSAILKAVQEQLRQVPNRGMGYGVLRYLSSDPRREVLRAGPMPQVVFSYTGQFDQTLAESPLFALAPESVGPAQDPRGRWPYLVDVYVHVVNGQLTVNCLYSKDLHHRSTLERVVESFVRALRALVRA